MSYRSNGLWVRSPGMASVGLRRRRRASGHPPACFASGKPDARASPERPSHGVQRAPGCGCHAQARCTERERETETAWKSSVAGGAKSASLRPQTVLLRCVSRLRGRRSEPRDLCCLPTLRPASQLFQGLGGRAALVRDVRSSVAGGSSLRCATGSCAVLRRRRSAARLRGRSEDLLPTFSGIRGPPAAGLSGAQSPSRRTTTRGSCSRRPCRLPKSSSCGGASWAGRSGPSARPAGGPAGARAGPEAATGGSPCAPGRIPRCGRGRATPSRVCGSAPPMFVEGGGANGHVASTQTRRHMMLPHAAKPQGAPAQPKAHTDRQKDLCAARTGMPGPSRARLRA